MNESPSASTFLITPKPAWVVKVLRNNGEKIFVNLCEHPDIPMLQLALNLGFNKWPFMIITPARTLQDGKGGGDGEDANMDISIYDAVVNPAVVNICAKDPQAKDATCLRIMRLLKKKFGEDLQLEYKLPKINKRYKGEIQQVLVPSNIQILAKSRSSVHVQVAAPGERLTLPGQSASETDSNTMANAGKINPRYDSSPLQRKLSEPMPASGNTATFQSNLSRKSETPPPGQVSSSSMPPPGQSRKSTMTKLFNNLDDSAHSSPGGVKRNDSLNNNSNPNSPALQRSYTEMNINTVSSVRAGAQRRSVRSSFLNPIADKNAFLKGQDPNMRKVVVPYIIVRSNGITAKATPDKVSAGKILGHGVKVFVVARRIMPDHVAWLKTTEGWIMEKVFAGTIHRVATPCIYGQPTAAKIINTRFEEHSFGGSIRDSYIGPTHTRETNGWFSFRASALKEMFQTRFNIEIMHQDNAMIRISRTFSEVLTLRAMLLAFNDKALKDRTMKAGEFPIMHDGDDELMADIHILVEVVESVESFLTKLFATVQVDRCKCKALKEFLTPKETDYQLMEVELMAEGGICGGWSNEIDQDLRGMDLTTQN
jgi:hypothetical protein